MTYSNALDIARALANANTKAAKLLRAMTKKTGRVPTFIIMRYGDPRKWRDLPRIRDHRELRYRSKYTKTRLCHLVNLDGREIRADSIADFCDKAGLPKVNRFHITPILNGERMSLKGWYLPETLARKVELRDIYGNVTTEVVRDLITTNRMKSATIRRLLEGANKSALDSRVMLADTPVNAPIAPRALRITKVKLIDGKRVYTGQSIPEVARKAGITNLPALYSIAYGFRDHFKGMMIKEIEVERKSVLKA